MMSSNVLFCPQSKDNQFTVIEEERNQKIFTFSIMRLHSVTKHVLLHYFLSYESVKDDKYVSI